MEFAYKELPDEGDVNYDPGQQVINLRELIDCTNFKVLTELQ